MFKPRGPKASCVGVLKAHMVAGSFSFFVCLDGGYFAKMQCLFGRPARQDL